MMDVPPDRAEMFATFDRLAGTLRDIAGERPLVFLLNPGNWGDSLIREGAEAFLNHHGFRYERVSLRDFRHRKVSVRELSAKLDHPDPVLLFNGNGMMKPGNDRLSIVADLTQQFKTSIFLPATYSVDPAAYGFAPSSHFFIREEAQSRAFLPKAPLCHDMAFFLRPSGLGPGHGVGYMFRWDSEAPKNQPIPKGNVDISTGGKTDTPIDGFLSHVARFETVHTNRLHVGIAAALLGRDTHLYANGYGKNRAIYEQSLRPYFANVRFAERFDVPPAEVQRSFIDRLRRIARRHPPSGRA